MRPKDTGQREYTLLTAKYHGQLPDQHSGQGQLNMGHSCKEGTTLNILISNDINKQLLFVIPNAPAPVSYYSVLSLYHAFRNTTGNILHTSKLLKQLSHNNKLEEQNSRQVNDSLNSEDPELYKLLLPQLDFLSQQWFLFVLICTNIISQHCFYDRVLSYIQMLQMKK